VDLILGLPLHPLINHVVAVLLPLSAIGIILLIALPKLRPAYSNLLLVTTITSAIAGVIAENSGEALANRVGSPGVHAEQGERLATVIVLLAILYVAWFVIQKKGIKFRSADKVVKRSIEIGLVILAILSVILTIIVGHSGAAATWQDRIKASGGQILSDPKMPEQTKADQKSAAELIVLSTLEIKKHNTQNDCWSIINGKVYNLTSFAQQHPGGSPVIVNLCGKDASAAFSSQHGVSTKPNNVLNGLLLGDVGAQLNKVKAMEVIAVPKSNYDDKDGEKDKD